MYAVVELPDFSLQAVLRPEPELRTRAVVLLDSSGGMPAVVLQMTEPARAAGVREGMTSTQAMARCPGVLFQPRDPAQEATAGQALLQCALLFSPLVEETAAGVCTLDLAGQGAAGTETWAARVLETLGRLQLSGRIGVGENPGLARHAARGARPFLAVANATAFLAGLPIESIEPSPEILGILGQWGIRTLGEFTSLGREAIAERLEGEGLALYERAGAGRSRPLRPASLPPVYEERMELEHEIESLEPLLFLLRRWMEQLAVRLELAGLVAAELRLELRLASGDALVSGLKIPSPTRDQTVLFRTLQTHLETVRSDHAVTGVSLRVMPGRETGRQFQLFEVALRNPNQFFETLARLVALVGHDRVGTPVMEDTHRPDAFQMRPVGFADAAPAAQPQLSDARPRAAGRLGLMLRRFRPPLAAEVELQESRPVRLRSARAHGRLERAEGPWRSSGDWWDQHPWDRDEWDVRTTTGELYRLYREGEQWFIAGIYD